MIGVLGGDMVVLDGFFYDFWFLVFGFLVFWLFFSFLVGLLAVRGARVCGRRRFEVFVARHVVRGRSDV